MAASCLLHLCSSKRKGIAKTEVASARLAVEHGLSGDAHAGEWHRQVSLLTEADIESMRAKGLKLKPGAFGENLVLDGVALEELGVGSRLRVGPVLLELTQVGKICHHHCAIYRAAGDCIMPRRGVFARVVEGGLIQPGVAVEVVEKVDRAMLQAAVITVSDRCARGETIDTAGPAVMDYLRTELKMRVAWAVTLPDEIEPIAGMLRDLCERRVDLVLTVGGTGVAPRDVTPEATRQVLDRELPGLAEAMRAASARVTAHAWLSRAVAGVAGEAVVINLPGSKKAASENLAAIGATIPHAIKMMRQENAHPENDGERQLATIRPVSARPRVPEVAQP